MGGKKKSCVGGREKEEVKDKVEVTKEDKKKSKQLGKIEALIKIHSMCTKRQAWPWVGREGKEGHRLFKMLQLYSSDCTEAI